MISDKISVRLFISRSTASMRSVDTYTRTRLQLDVANESRRVKQVDLKKGVCCI